MKKIILLLAFCFVIFNANSQIYSNIKSIRISNAQGMPPDLHAKLSFNDFNGNNILEANESAEITMIITNSGKGIAQNLYITVSDDLNDNNLIIKDKIKILRLYPAQTDTFQIDIFARMGIKTNTHNLTINISEGKGFGMQPVTLTLPTIEYQKPELKLVGVSIIEAGDDVYIKNYDGKIEKGERVKVKLSVQNIGKNIAQNTSFKVISNDDNVLIFNNIQKIGDIRVGEVKEFTFTLLPNNNANISGKLPLFLDVTDKYNFGSINNLQLPIELNQKPPEPQIVEISPNYDAFNQQALFVFDNQKYSLNDDLSLDTDIPKNAVKSHSFALVIGNANYHTNGSDLPNLRYTLNDAYVFKQYVVNMLGVPEDNQHLYYVEDANYSTMLKNLNSFKTLIQNSSSDDIFYIYYSGHGAQNSDSVPFLMPVDATMQMLSNLGIKLSDFYSYLTPPEGKGKVIVLLDACFSGEKININAKVGLRRPSHNPDIQSNMLVIAASSGKQISQEYPTKSHGIFTYFLLKILQDSKGIITYGELSDKIIEGVHLTSLNPQNGFVEQKPQVNSSIKLGNQWRNWKVY